MRIAWLNEGATPIGGAERYVRETARELGVRGVESLLFYDVNVSPDPHPVMQEPFEGVFPIVDLARQLRELAPDVVYVHQLASLTAQRALLDSPAPVVRFFHDHRLFCLREHKYTTLGKEPCTKTVGAACYPCLGFVGRSNEWPGVKLASLGRLREEQELARRHHAFVVGSRYMVEHVVAHGFERERMHVIPLYAQVPPAPRTPVAREEDLLLFAGQLTTGKGLDVLFRALARTTQPCRLVVVGKGRQEAELRAMVDGLGVSDRVSFLGPLVPEGLSALYRRAACVVFPSRAPETSGLVGIEALGHGTPVIASRVGGVGEWLTDGETGLGVRPNEPVALAAAIDRLMAEPELRRAMGENALKTYQERFVPERHVTRLLALLEAVAIAGRRAA
ncbi:glycosyltransferase family 4 protein [Pyxidicoccus xibeiensis]|uniref:glycosyltransferase family 4 protein n=1 Tax=Pyxidicoccus xibeiensis TaxID=2906759 RepID=UPI0020A76717|nr:glycosyltransferase family 4 protein [Pyxidicoccus xibeiensis]MCP3137426.1 glycosyltransferase family 4 protein [Pyxidicoccus xibeiensis]